MLHKFGEVWSKLPICPICKVTVTFCLSAVCLVMLINSVHFFSLNDKSPSKIIQNIFLFNRKSYFLLLRYSNFCDFFYGGQRFLQWKFESNSRTFQEHIILFKNISDVENIIAIDLKGFFKKLNLIITKDKSHEIQIWTIAKLRKS